MWEGGMGRGDKAAERAGDDEHDCGSGYAHRRRSPDRVHLWDGNVVSGGNHRIDLIQKGWGNGGGIALRVYSIDRVGGNYKAPCINCQNLCGNIVHFTE